MGGILYIIGAVLIIFWLLGFLLFHIGPIIHAVLVIAVIVFLYQFITGRRSI